MSDYSVPMNYSVRLKRLKKRIKILEKSLRALKKEPPVVPRIPDHRNTETFHRSAEAYLKRYKEKSDKLWYTYRELILFMKKMEP